jgi:sec-independent protein translocase protein TatA
MELFQPWHLLIVAGIAILLFGGRKLPELGKGLGEGLRGFKEGMKGITETPAEKSVSDAHTVTPQPVVKTDEATKPPVA